MLKYDAYKIKLKTFIQKLQFNHTTRRIFNLLTSVARLIFTFMLTMAIGFLFGIILSRKTGTSLANSGKTIMFIILLIFSSFVVIYFAFYSYVNPLIIKYKSAIRFLYFSFSFLLFISYYNFNYSRILSQYSQNNLGISQTQYVFVVNLLLYLIISTVIYFTIFSGYIVKSISEKGIEIEFEKDISDEQQNLVEDYSMSIEDLTNKIVNAYDDCIHFIMKNDIAFGKEVKVNLILDFIDKQLIDLCNNYESVMGVTTIPRNNIDTIKDEFVLSNPSLKYIKKKIDDYIIFSYKNLVFVPFVLNSYGAKPTITIVEFDSKETTLTDIGLAILTYLNYIDLAFETIFYRRSCKI